MKAPEQSLVCLSVALRTVGLSLTALDIAFRKL